MTAELLGWTKVLGAFVRRSWSNTRERWSRALAFPPPDQLLSGRVSKLPVRRGNRGFTLTELSVTVGVAGVLSAVAVPAVTPMIAEQQVKSATFDLYAALSYARSEAIKRNSVVTIVPRGGNFANGYDLDVGGVVLKSHAISSSVAVSAPEGTTLAFDGYGRLTTPAAYQFELSATQYSGVADRCVVISPAGRPSIRTDSNHDGNCING